MGPVESGIGPRRPASRTGGRLLIRGILGLCIALSGCAGLHGGDPVLGPLDKFLNGPVLNLTLFLGPPSRSSGVLDRRSYRWEFRDASGQECSLAARVDEQEGVIDIQRRGAAPICAQYIADRDRIAR